MIIHFGLYRDGLDPSPPQTSFGEARLGPLGFLGVLETDLGLPPVFEHPAEQLTRYRGCLAEADDLARFYHAAFAVDPINVTKTLMAWRADWYEAGWDGTFKTNEQRLADMADVEKLAKNNAARCIGQRLGDVLRSLKKRRTQVERLILLDEPTELPLAWRRVVDKIGYEIHVGVNRAPARSPATDLQRLQSALARAATDTDTQETHEQAHEKVLLEGDGSVLVVRGVSRDISARAIAESLRESNDPNRHVVIAERDGIIFDNALERSALPRCGFLHHSRFRAVSQVLKLALALVWEPISPHLLLQFLVHPLGPLNRGTRRPLAEAVADQPGIGGEQWRDGLERIQSNLRKADASEERIDEVIAAIRYWLESPRFAAHPGVPIEVVTERAQRCANWLSRRLATAGDDETPVYASAVAQCHALIESLGRLADQRQSRIEKIELDRLLDEVARAQPDAQTFSQAGHVRAATRPGVVVDQFEEVIWWDLSAQTLDFAYPWSRRELQALGAAGVELHSAEVRLDQLTQRWLRPILNCTRRLILVVHHSDEGQHPLWSQIQHRFAGWAELRLDDTLLGGEADALEHLDVATPPLTVQPLKAPRRWWTLPPEIELPAREVESYTSLSKLVDHPHEWVLHYAARLRPGRASDLHDGPILYGSLAHRMLDLFFSTQPKWATMPTEAIHAWLEAKLPPLLAAEGAVLLERGRGVDRQFVTSTLERALLRLIEHFNSARIVNVETEQHEQAPSQGEMLQGDIDLLLTDDAGRQIVMDAKWGSERYRINEMEANRHLQLATYAYLHRATTGANRWPYPAYYIITTGNVLAPDHGVFPEAIVQTSAAGGTTEDLWAQSEITRAWRREQLANGQIEVNVAGTAPTERSAPPPGGLDTRTDPDRFDDFGWLTGHS